MVAEVVMVVVAIIVVASPIEVPGTTVVALDTTIADPRSIAAAATAEATDTTVADTVADTVAA